MPNVFVARAILYGGFAVALVVSFIMPILSLVVIGISTAILTIPIFIKEDFN